MLHTLILNPMTKPEKLQGLSNRHRDTANTIVGRTRDGEVISSFKSAGGRTVRVLNSDVYRKASESAGKRLSEITGKKVQ